MAVPFWEKQLLDGPGQEGEMYQLGGGEYTYRAGILRQRGIYSPSQDQTKEAFGFKWSERNSYGSDAGKARSRRWLVQRYLQRDEAKIDAFFPEGARVLDAGCGSGYSARILVGDLLERIHYLGVDISDAVDVAQSTFSQEGIPGTFIQADFTDLPFDEPTFDVLFAEGTLHHTDSTEGALRSLVSLLVEGGRAMFYVYREKGPIREFTDDFVRGELEGMGERETWDAIIPLTKLGAALGEMDAVVDVPEDIPFLEIEAGPIDLQRFFYWHVCKTFFHPNLSLEEMNHINFDWYRPDNAHRHTPEEVEGWCKQMGLDVEHMDVQRAGITVVAQKTAGATPH